MIGLPLAPFDITYRELWLPPSINANATLPTSVEGGHGLTLTGARKGTTCDGVHGIPGVATSNINLGAIHDNENILYIKIRFKLDQPFSIAAATDQYLFGKYDGPNDYLIGWLEADDGMFHMAHAEGGVVEAIISAEDTWDIGWHTILVSLHTVNGQRLIVDGGAVVEETLNTTAITLTADFVLMARDDGVSIEGLAGVEVDVVIGNIVLTVVQEGDLSKGIPPANATESYLLDEGRGVTAVNRGTSGAGADGTLDTSCTWKFGQVQQPILSLDGRNDYGQSAAGVDISDDVTIFIVEKVKVNFISEATASALSSLIIYIDANNYIHFYKIAGADLRWIIRAQATDLVFTGMPLVSIDSYRIFLLSITKGVRCEVLLNGSSIDEGVLATSFPAGGATVYLGRRQDAYGWVADKNILTGIISGAFTQKQALAYSRYLKNVFNLPISI